MRKIMPYMVLDITKKLGDPDAVKTGNTLLIENTKLRDENARLRAALKPVLECKVLSTMTAEVGKGESDYCSNIIFKAQRIYNEWQRAKKARRRNEN